MTDSQDMTWCILGGCPRSGTTGMMTALNAHPSIGLIPEYGSLHLIGIVNQLFYKENNIKKKAWIGDINYSPREGAQVLVGEFISTVPRKEDCFWPIVKSVFDSTHKKDVRIVGEKLPTYWEMDLKALEQEVGKLRIIHLMRRPSDVLNSFMHRAQLTAKGLDQWRYTDFTQAVAMWLHGWRTAYTIRNQRRDLILPLKYEELLAYPDTFERIADFLNIEEKGFGTLVESSRPRHEALSDEQLGAAQALFGDMEKRWDDPIDVLMLDFPPTQLDEKAKSYFAATSIDATKSSGGA